MSLYDAERSQYTSVSPNEDLGLEAYSSNNVVDAPSQRIKHGVGDGDLRCGGNGADIGPSSPKQFSLMDGLVVSPASSSLGGSPVASPSRPTKLNNGVEDDDDDVPLNPFRLNFDDDGDKVEERAETSFTNGNSNIDECKPMNGRESNLINSESCNSINEDENLNTGGRTSPTLSLSLSVMSGYDTEEDEDGVLRRYGSHVLASTKHAASVLGIRSDDEDEESVYSAVNTSAEYEDGVTGDSTPTTADTSYSSRPRLDSRFSRSSSGANSNRRQKQKRPRDRIKDVINGMRRAHEEAQLQRSTRRFIAMSEGQRTASGWTESICLSPWCDFSSRRGLILMVGVVSLCVLVAVALSKGGHLGWGIWVVVGGVLIIFLKVFWVPIYWLVWGQFVEKRRRRVMQVYDTLNGEHPGGIEIPVHDFDRDNEFQSESEFSNEDTGRTSAEMV